MENLEQEKNQTPEEAFERLKIIVEFLREKGFRVANRFIKIESIQDSRAFPIVDDEAQGIRASYDDSRGLIIWFTNGFEDSENPRRKEVEEFLHDHGW